jgi:hypothetical protein
MEISGYNVLEGFLYFSMEINGYNVLEGFLYFSMEEAIMLGY